MLKGLFGKRGRDDFKTRSVDRDRLADAETLGTLAQALEAALGKMQSEHNGLSRRVDDATAMASLVVGTDSDEYLSREVEKTASLREFENDVKLGRDRLRTLDRHILNLRFLRAAFLTRFPEFNTKDKPPESA
jgi:hypothetical protein